MAARFDPARRRTLQALRGRAERRPAVRPPWSIVEESFLAGCTRCGACIDTAMAAIRASISTLARAPSASDAWRPARPPCSTIPLPRRRGPHTRRYRRHA
jgi:ferredoxin